jgi:hypothetical protein
MVALIQVVLVVVVQAVQALEVAAQEQSVKVHLAVQVITVALPMVLAVVAVERL